MQFGVLLHPLDLVLRQTARSRDGNLLLPAGSLVLGRNVQNTVGINIESNFDFRNATRRGRNTVQDKAAQALVFGSHRALALYDVDFDAGLPIGGGAEHFTALVRDGGVALDQRSSDATQGLDRKG